MLRTLTNTVRKLYGDPPLIRDLETWANDTAKLATPDDLIAASIIQSFAKDYGDWKLVGSLEPIRDYTRDNKPGSPHKVWKPAKPTLTNSKTGVTVVWIYTRTFVPEPPYQTIGTVEDAYEGCSVNGTHVTTGLQIRQAWDEISAKVKAAEATAAKAKADMEANEAKWNLAETLLGMKRNEYGALVPIRTVAS